MERGNVAAPRQGVLVPVLDSSDAFVSSILTRLQSAYLHEESRQSFTYKSAVLIKNAVLEEKYEAFRAKKRQQGYSDEELKETYGFLLFDDINKAHALGETGLLTGNSSCTTLGDPSKGVYLSMFSDCLDLDRWRHGKSGYIAIIRLTKGRLKKVSENYTQNFTTPTLGFDCHVSKELRSVSAKTSSFLTFERTQYYIYELVRDGSFETAQSPSAACPFALVSFSYMDLKDTLEVPPHTSWVNKSVSYYQSWRGQLQIGPQVYAVGVKSVAGALIPTKLPPVIKLDKTISMLNLMPLLPKAAFLTGFSGEACLDGLYLSLYELVLLEEEKVDSFSLFLQELKKKDLALPIPLIDGGFLILLHSSNFLTYKDASEFLQAMFIFPDSRTMDRGSISGPRKATASSEILQALPMLRYAEDEVEKTNMDSSETLGEVMMKHMQNYAVLTSPPTQSSPSREDAIHPDQYDVLPVHKLLYSSPEWTNKAWQRLKSYLSKPVSFQLPLSKASEILADEQEVQREDLVDVYVSSSPEKASDSQGERLPSAKDSVAVLPSVDSVKTSADVHDQFLPRLVKSDFTHTLHTDSEQTEPNRSDAIGAKVPLIPTTSDNLSAELIVSITSAEQTVPDGSLNLVRTMTVTKHDDFPISDFSQTKLQTGEVNHLHNHTPDVNNFTNAKLSEVCGVHSKGMKKSTDASEDNVLMSFKGEQAEKSSRHLKPNNSSSTTWRNFRKRKLIFEKLPSNNKKITSVSVDVTVTGDAEKSDSRIHKLETSVFSEHETSSLRKKNERWELKPIVSECGRILVPHGSVDVAGQILSLKCQPESKSIPEEGTVGMQQESTCVTTADGPETASSKNEVYPPADRAGPLNKENNVVTQPDIGSLFFNSENGEESSTEVVKDGIEEKNTCVLSKSKLSTNGKVLLHKLKSVLSKGKRKKHASGNASTDTEEKTEPCLKKNRVDGKTEAPRDNDSTTENNKVIPSVDPLFARALGLTPTERPDTGPMHEGQDCQQSRASPGVQVQTIPYNQPELVLKPQPDPHRRSKIKTLKKHQGLSAECLKKTWWLHVKTPGAFQNKNCNTNDTSVGDMSVTKIVDGEKSNACSADNALNLLADLALGASGDLIHPSPRLCKISETSVKSYIISKDVRDDPQDSVLHALLRKPAKLIQDPDSSIYLMEKREHVALLTKEHNYSSPQSYSLLLSLPQSPFQVDPLSGSTSLMHRHQQLHSNINEKLNASVCQEDKQQHDYCYNHPKKHKFRIVRSFVKKAESVQVTREWKKSYNFKGDCQLSSDAKSKAIMRALHGPCNLSFKDAIKDVRLIVHMWIGLFYSRSMPRIFDMDCDITNQCPGEGALEMSNDIPSAPDKSKLQASAFEASPKSLDLGSETGENLISKAWYQPGFDQRPAVPDTPPRDCSRDMETPDPEIKEEKPSVSAEKKDPLSQVNSTDSFNEMRDTKSCCEETNTPRPSQNPASLELNRLVWKESFIPTEKFHTPSGTGHIKSECIKETRDVGNSPTTTVAEEHQEQSSIFLKDVKFSIVDVETDPTVGLMEKIQLKDEKNFALKKRISEPSSKEMMSYDGSSIRDVDWKNVENEKCSSEQSEAALVPPKEISEDMEVCSEHGPDLKEDELDENQRLISVKKTQNNESEQPLPTNSFTGGNCHTIFNEPLHGADHDHEDHESCGVVSLKQGAFKSSPMGDNEDSKLGETTVMNEHAISKENVHQTEYTNEKPTVVENSLQLEAEAHNPSEGPCVVDSTTKINHKLVQETKSHVLCDLPQAAVMKCTAALVQGVSATVSNLNRTIEELRKSPDPSDDAIPFPGTPVTCLQEKIAAGQKGIRFTSETFRPDLFTVVCRTHQILGIKGERCAGQISFTKSKEISQPAKFGNGSDERCPTPTLDEPSQSVPVSVSDSFTTKTSGKSSPAHLGSNSTTTKDSGPDEPKLCPRSGERLDTRSDLDLEQRTLRVLHSIKEFLPKSNAINSTQQTEITDSKSCLYQNPNLKFKPTSVKQKRIKNKKLKSFKQAAAPASTSHKLHKVPDDHLHTLPFKVELEKAKSSYSNKSLRPDGSRIDKEPVPDSVETSANPDDGDIQLPSNNKYTNVSCPKPTTMSSGETENVLGPIETSGHDEAELSKSSVSQLLANNDSSSHLDNTSFTLKDPLYQCPEGNTTRKTPNERSGQKNCSEASISFENKDDEIIKEEPPTSLICTVFNTGDRISCSFLEHVSQRCVQRDPTQASVEQESLIFSEEMKQLFKRFKREASSQEGTQNESLSCTGPMTVDFSSLEERDDSLDLLDAPSLAGIKIKVDTSDREERLDTTRRESACSLKTSPGPESSNKYDPVNDVTAKYAKLYKAKMDEACSPTKSQPTHFGMSRSHNKTEPGDSLDFCEQMKQDMERSFRSRLNMVVKKSCKTKYRFYILVTSDDDIFEETKAQLEMVGHTAVQPSEFFLGQNSSSPLLIILRNEDIAEHISKVPHLLQLKKTSCVQFAGIDEPDDVVNLTHQELFTRGGFIMFDRAALKDLTLCNMKKCSAILHELRKTGKWKWIFHYRDSRRLKENARTSAEEKQKKNFLNVCEDEGILEVLPYHECDVTSRDQSDYLTCLVRLQVHNISARYPVFITDAATDGAFGRNGIFTVTLDYFLTNFSSETFLF